MQVLVVSATEMEIASFVAQNTGTDYFITGVGAPATLYGLQKKLQTGHYDFVLQAGIAGSFNPSLALGETVLVKKDVFADLGIMDNNRLVTLFEAGFVDKNDHPYTDGWLPNNNEWLDRIALPKHDAVTVNMVTSNKQVIDEYHNIFSPSIESMEGAALHYVCLMEGVPFLQLRSVSNEVGERDKSKWNIAAAIHNLNNHLQEIVQVLKQHA